VIDCYSRKVVGWAMAGNYKPPLIQDAFMRADRNVTRLDLTVGWGCHSAALDTKVGVVRRCPGSDGVNGRKGPVPTISELALYLLVQPSG
jgi:hypothetical protein